MYAQLELDALDNNKKMLQVDSNYIFLHRYKVVSRLYLSRKYTHFSLPNANNKPILFRSNGTVNMGVGFTFKGITLNVAYGFPFMNGDGSQRGTSKYLDLQMHMYGRRNVLDIYAQLYKGFYNNRGAVAGYNGYYSNPDVAVADFGFNYTRIANHRRFSMRSGANQDERQLKSAGSFLYGIEAMFGTIRNDEGSIVSDQLQALAAFHKVSKIVTLNVGPNMGYGYNFVFAKYYMLSGAFTFGTTFSYYEQIGETSRSFSSFSGISERDYFRVSPTTTLRIAAGINKERWAVLAYYVHNTTTTHVDYAKVMTNNIGNYRLNFVYRFKPAKSFALPFTTHQ